MIVNDKKTNSLILGISEDEKVTLGNERFDQVGSFISLGRIFSKDVKSRIAKAQGVISQQQKVWKNRRINMQIKVRILEGTEMKVV